MSEFRGHSLWPHVSCFAHAVNSAWNDITAKSSELHSLQTQLRWLPGSPLQPAAGGFLHTSYCQALSSYYWIWLHSKLFSFWLYLHPLSKSLEALMPVAGTWEVHYCYMLYWAKCPQLNSFPSPCFWWMAPSSSIVLLFNLSFPRSDLDHSVASNRFSLLSFCCLKPSSTL